MSRKLPDMEVNNYTSIFTKPIFKNQNGEWFRDVGYIDSLDLIRENFQGAAKSFIAIGYYLKHIKEKELYKDGNYQNIWECAQAEFGLSQSAASRYMNMNDAFSVNGNTPLLDDKYDSFNKSQLQEMLALPDEIREEIKPEQTVNEIRNISRNEKELKEPSEAEVKKFYEYHAKMYDDNRSKLKELLIHHLGKSHSGGNSGGINYRCSLRGVRIGSTEEITWAQLVRLVNLYIPSQPADSKQTSQELEEEQLPGQMYIEDYPEILPDAYKEIPIYQPVFTKSEIEEWKNSVVDVNLKDRINTVLDGCIKYQSNQVLFKVSYEYKSGGIDSDDISVN